MRLNLNVYGSRFTFGLQGDGATPIGADVLVRNAADRGFDGVEVPAVLLRPLPADGLARVRDVAADRSMDLVLSTFGTQVEQLSADVRIAHAIGASTMVTALENTLFGGDRRPHVGRWPELMHGVRDRLRCVAPVAADLGVRIGVENHQDVDSSDLAWLCSEIQSDAVGVTFDTANGLGVAEHPVDFLRAVLPHVVYVHLKDYVVTWAAEGYQLIRCPVGEGVVPYADLLPILAGAGGLARASVEVGALVPRVVRSFAADFWSEYPARPPLAVSRLYALLAPHAAEERDAPRTPFELGRPHTEITTYEESQLDASLQNARRLAATLSPSAG